jgi:hypothetical protein
MPAFFMIVFWAPFPAVRLYSVDLERAWYICENKSNSAIVGVFTNNKAGNTFT